MSKKPKLAYHQRTAVNNNNREETSSVVEYEYTGSDHHVPNNATHVRIHSSITTIESYSFHGKLNLKEVVLSEGLEEIGLKAFANCKALQSITIPSTGYDIGAEAFNSCANLREVQLNDGLKKIAGHSFQSCTSLRSITIPSSVLGIGSEAFSSCSNLRDVVLHDGIKKIGRGAFYNCTSLERIAIPSTIIEIGDSAFRDCIELREIVLHNEGLQIGLQIGVKAFANCSSLERFKFPSLSTRLDNIIQAGQRDIEAKMDDIPAVEWRGGELSIPTVHREIENGWGRMETLVKTDKEKLNKIVTLVRYYEIKEATALFELALWKSKISQAEGDSTDRGACRVEVPGPVKDAILQYL